MSYRVVSWWAKWNFSYFWLHCVCRDVLIVNGKKAIHEALITKSVDFADRPEFYTQSLVNADAKG